MSDIGFLGFNSTPLTLSHRELIESYLKIHQATLSDYTFVSLIGWNSIFRYEWAELPGKTLLIGGYRQNSDRYYYLEPLGDFPLETQKLLLDRLALSGYPVKISAVSKEFLSRCPDFCSHFVIEEDPNAANYLYKAADLAQLKGRQFEKKRNLISQIDRFYPWTIKPLFANCPDCHRILSDIGPKKAQEKTLQNELRVLDTILRNYDELNLKGYMITIDGKVVAFSIVDTLNPSTKVVIFEKAERNFNGLHQLINRETSKAIYEDGYEWINREGDLGVSGLRKAKLSYHPAEIIPSYTLTFPVRS